jgi:hypothetical protein
VGVFRTLNLKAFWWHRLAIVLFVGLVIYAFGHTYNKDIGKMEKNHNTCLAINAKATALGLETIPCDYDAPRSSRAGLHGALIFIFSWYLLQIIYRCLLYVAFGPIRSEPSASS